MTALGGLALLALGALLAYPAGWLRCYRLERKHRNRANWRCDQLIAANGQLQTALDRLSAFAPVDAFDLAEWDAELEGSS